jgi:esterase/lipase superfamily enzyme
MRNTVLFATNRQRAPGDVNGFPSFDDQAMPPIPDSLYCAKVTVDGIDISRPEHGQIVAMGPITTDAFAPADLDAIATSKNDVLVFVHGASNSFEDAVTRAAYNRTWLAAARIPNTISDFDTIVFSWPAQSYQFWDPLGIPEEYQHDQQEAVESAYQFGVFLDQMRLLRGMIGDRKMNLLCHSMGNFMLAGAIAPWVANLPAGTPPLFDVAILAAADEAATSFATPGGARLASLDRLAQRVTLYFNYDDVMMHLSLIANGDFRLGYDGPPNRGDTAFFPRAVYDFVDCTDVNDYISSIFDQPDRSHQYYRQSPTVRLDIAQVLVGLAPHRLKYDSRANVFSLFP